MGWPRKVPWRSSEWGRNNNLCHTEVRKSALGRERQGQMYSEELAYMVRSRLLGFLCPPVWEVSVGVCLLLFSRHMFVAQTFRTPLKRMWSSGWCASWVRMMANRIELRFFLLIYVMYILNQNYRRVYLKPSPLQHMRDSMATTES